MRFLLVTLTLFISCGYNHSFIKGLPEKIGELLNTKWIHQPFNDVPECIDTLIFINKISGLDYSCEHELYDSLKYQIRNDTLNVDVYDNVSEVDANQGLEIKSKYVIIMVDGNLKMIDIKHKNDGFESIDQKYLVGQIYKRSH